MQKNGEDSHGYNPLKWILILTQNNPHGVYMPSNKLNQTCTAFHGKPDPCSVRCCFSVLIYFKNK